ncbi:MAG TPA: UDP-N-acetylmuramoyl-L-alanine--D-glutamate ligase [Bacteroidales bacterium]|nr:UDP-N-acetylmuramoyl-L-alanine--D-glutamate ligase [Bacteroidales bacterium]
MSGRTVILGAGESGTGAAILAHKLGMEVMVSDAGLVREPYRSTLTALQVPFEESGHKPSLLQGASEVVKSPGIPEEAPVVTKARSLGLPVISEIEFASRHTRGKRICITGSNGKTTTSHLVYHILRRAGMQTVLCGNVGDSFARRAAETKADYWVLEISSFQLDGMFDFRADIAILLNITPDHLDRYQGSFERYAASKFRILRNQTASDAFIYNADDPVIRQYLALHPPDARSYAFGLEDAPQLNAAWVGPSDRPWTSREMNINIAPEPLAMTLENLALQGRHNIYNSMAAGIATRLLDIRKETIKECLSDFEHIEHRLEVVGNVHGIEFINDSKATNVNAAWFALESQNKPVVWIAGGTDKGNDYSMLKDLVKHKVKAIVCLGKDNSRIKAAFADVVETILETGSAEEAVNEAYYLGRKGDVVLLSPACASFDLFTNYEERGRAFKQAVAKL